MPTNRYFNNYRNNSEQTLMEDLFIEAIKIYGMDLYYIPRVVENKDELYGEDTISTYREAYLLEMYVKSVDGYEGDGIFLSKFGLEVRDQVTFTVSIRSFKAAVPQTRPNEGDLIWFNLNPDRNQLLVVKYVNDRSIFYQLGHIKSYDLVCEMFEYSSERFETGIEEIDQLELDRTIDITQFSILTSNNESIRTSDGYALIYSGFDYETALGGDAGSDNEFLQSEANNILDFTDTDPFSDGSY